MSEQLRLPNNVLRFYLDGCYYALEQDIYDDETRMNLERQMQEWFPGIQFVEEPPPEAFEA